ncbi:NUDIX hydrolase [Algibacter amylolyticus]|uniref:NUDIX hydrolase n=1 Tax=Algibacter amylolyticus TaxID=1608400 RepID=A0A5M7B195_9FLAO|nr:NUDIX hydrolase [Algibacter amylolyticus]KAA5821937.1 NUDIX hydrolase [Algibacter amylolyticus]MBB5269264.1 ADP-ribose pyrophosphatase YjhB (NUDIX family) [Algibacter amylolyticus]TSJ73221.1 NUDIX hydrolase [Algibacter amylolyticus]
MDFRKRDNVSVDCVIFGLDTDGLNILLHKRTLNMYNDNYPVIDDWVICGGRVYISKTLEASANIIFQSSTGYNVFNRTQFRTYGNPSRIKSDKDLLWVRSHGVKTQSMTIAYYFTQPKDCITVNEKHFKWFPIKGLPELGFDHSKIIKDAHEDLMKKIMVEPIIFNLMPDKFTLNELQFAFESILDIELDNRNFRKKVLKKIYIVPLNETKKGNAKKPSKLYVFSREVYNKVTEKDFIVNV